MIFCQNNFITLSNLTVNGERSSFPKDNIISNRLNETTYFEGYIDIDLGSSISIDTIAYSGDVTPYLIASDNSIFFGAEYAVTLDSVLKFTSQAYRYWRLLLGSYETYTNTNYATGTDVDLDSPSGAYDTSANLVPCLDSGTTGLKFNLATVNWIISGGTVGSDSVYSANLNTSYGQARFSVSSGTWNQFASVTSGVKRMDLPKLANGDNLGGYVDYYYDETSWTYAFNGTSSNIVIAQNGSVYKGTVSDANLVIRWDGKLGPAGSASPEVSVDINRVQYTANTALTGNINHLYIGTKLILPDPRYGSIPNDKDTDIETYSVDRLRFTTNGVLYNEQTFNFDNVSKEKHDELKVFSQSTYRNDSGYFAQTEDNLALYDPFFAKIKLSFIGKRDANTFRLRALVTEQK